MRYVVKESLTRRWLESGFRPVGQPMAVQICSGNLAVFPPLKVNADFAWSKNLSMQSKRK